MKNDRIYIDCLAYQISLAQRKISSFYGNKLSSYGLTPVYVYVLGILKDDGPSSLTHIAQILQLERASVSTLLTRMERDGFILRSQGEERRKMSVELTSKGREVMNAALGTLVKADKTLDSCLNGELQKVKQLLVEINSKI